MGQVTLSWHADLFNLIPEDHLLRKIAAVVDVSFVNDLVVDSYCKYYGRPAKEPELMLRLLTVLSRFRTQRLARSEATITGILDEVGRQCLEKGLIKSKRFVVEATHFVADTQMKRPLDVLRAALQAA